MSDAMARQVCHCVYVKESRAGDMLTSCASSAVCMRCLVSAFAWGSLRETALASPLKPSAGVAPSSSNKASYMQR